jgi:hypothetical protein
MSDEELVHEIADLGDLLDELRDKMTEARRELLAVAAELEPRAFGGATEEYYRHLAERVRTIAATLALANPSPPMPPVE